MPQSPPSLPSGSAFEALREEVIALARVLDEEAAARAPQIEAALPQHRTSALNLAHYLGLRQRDVRALQLTLAAKGLSSLGRCEGHVRDTVEWLSAWLCGTAHAPGRPHAYPDAAEAERLLHVNARALFGPRPKDRHVYIMVTAPEAAAATPEWADSLVGAGANLLRINGAHESPREWERIAATFRARAALAQVPVRIVVDLPGPKLRTEIRQLEAGVIHLRRHKDPLGRTLAPAVVKLVAASRTDDELPLPPSWLPRLRVGDLLMVTQPNGRVRELSVTHVEAGQARAESQQSLYCTGGAPVIWRRRSRRLACATIPAIPDAPRRITLSVGDEFLVNADGLTAEPGRIALALAEPALLSAVRPGERVILDDGRLVALATERRRDGLLCRVSAAVKPAVRLRGGKGIAFPDTDIVLESLGEEDEVALGFALEHADVAGISFVNSPADVERVGSRIRRSGKQGFGMILKLETSAAMHNLPAILFEALRHAPVGLMIARGDLAIDVGFERLAEMQEELLWFGEACHLPVVWATQVLESVTHSGLPTRAEVTDAAMSMRAECVMLNKGPYVATANRLLDDIIRKMEAHQYKKRALYRPLSMAGAASRD